MATILFVDLLASRKRKLLKRCVLSRLITNAKTKSLFRWKFVDSNENQIIAMSQPKKPVHTHTTKKESVLWQDKLKSLIQDPAHRGEHVTETWAALLETKESRIAIMERDISLLEKELLQQQQLMQQQRDHWVRSIEQSNPSTPVPRTATPSQQAAVAAAQLYRNSPVNNGQTAQHKDAVSLLLFFYCLPFFVLFF